VKFARAVKEPQFETREVIGEKEATTLATEILAMSEDEFRAAFRGSAMTRAKRAGLRRNAAIALHAPEAEGHDQRLRV
jgi:epoxyqueuosine reductase QueG